MSQETINALILAFSSLAAAWLSYRGIKYQIDRARQKKAANPDAAETDEAIVRYEDNPAKFVKDLRDDNHTLREEVRKLDAERLKDREAVDQAIAEVRKMRDELDSLKRDDVRFRDALGRWLSRLFLAWGKSESMPWPPSDDAVILQSVLPPRNANKEPS